MRAGVFRPAMSHPGNVSALEQPILTGAVRARQIAAVIGKTESEAPRHRGAPGEPAQGVPGDTPVFVWGGAEHQGPDGCVLIAVTAETPVTSRSTSCAS
ncbi:MAG: hypothetical protein J2P50_03385 [Hyphomicrobiaceae bacterium]|nr:hypothetical protein [Hyphomicrobiaceae bacterium]